MEFIEITVQNTTLW